MNDRISGLLKAVFNLVLPSICLLLSTAADQLRAQTSTVLPLEALTIDNGLSQGFVSAMVQDQKGLMWFTTSDGLNKYDGYTFTVYRHDPDDPASPGSDDLSCIAQDSQGRIWIGTRHNGLDLFDQENEVFTHIRHGSANSLRSDNILAVVADKTGNLWVRTDKGVDRMQTGPGNRFWFTHIRLDSAFEAVKFRFMPEKVFADSRNHVFITSHNKVWEVENGWRRTVKLVERYRFPVVDSLLVANILEDTVTHCLLLNNGKIIKFPGYDFRAATLLYAPVRSQIPWTIDQRQQLWLPDSNRIIRIDIASGTPEVIRLTEPWQVRGIFHSTRYYTDRSGVIWMGTAGFGILKYNPQKEVFHHGLPQVVTYELAENKQGAVIANGLFALEIKKGRPFYSSGIVTGARAREELLPNRIGSFTIDTAGTYWYGRPQCLIRYDAATGGIRRFPVPQTEKVTQPMPVYSDKSGGIWMGYNRYLFRFDVPSAGFTRYEYPLGVKSYDFSFLQCIYEDGGTLWLGSINGLFRLDTASRQMKYFGYIPANPHSLSNNSVISLCNDRQQPEKYLWIGTLGGGLNRMEKQSGRIKRYTTKEGLPNNTIYGILPDNKGHLWISTNKGLSDFDPSRSTFTNFDVSDGLQSNEFNRYAYCKTRQGLLVFGGMNGINYFDPGEIRAPEPPQVILTDFRLFNGHVSFKEQPAPLNKSITFSDAVTLRYEQNVITFQFAAMDYRKPASARYRYMLHGFDKSWIYSGTVREATYTNLDPGTYRFVVQGSFSEGVWSRRGATVLVTVIPPWWRTWWFYALVIAGTGSVLYALYRYRLQQVLKLERVRNRIARDLHDEVGSSISTIAIYSRIIQEQLSTTTFNTEPLVNKITDNAQDIMESMNDIVWNINTKNDAFDHIINRMREHAYQLFEAKGYTLHFYFDEALARMKLGMEKRRDFYLIYKEALNNIAKYAQGKNVWITVRADNATVSMTIKDDGRGFDLLKTRQSSNGLSNMHYRTAAIKGTITIDSSPGTGTEIRVVFQQ